MRTSLVVLVVVVVACSSSPSHAATSPSVSSGGYLGSLGSAGCKQAPAFRPWNGGPPEVGVDSRRGSLWALVFDQLPLTTGHEIKVVWRMTGAGDFTFKVTDTDGAVVPLAWGPDAHGDSNWDHPGAEVGTGLSFPRTGCWHVHVARTSTSGDLWVEVAAPA